MADQSDISKFRYLAIGAFDNNYNQVSIEKIAYGQIESVKSEDLSGFIVADMTNGTTVAMTSQDIINYDKNKVEIRGLKVAYPSDKSEYVMRKWGRILENLNTYVSKYGFCNNIGMTQDFANVANKKNGGAKSKSAKSSSSNPNQGNQNVQALEARIQQLEGLVQVLKQHDDDMYTQLLAVARKVDSLNTELNAYKKASNINKIGKSVGSLPSHLLV
jgi:hypothetical protein